MNSKKILKIEKLVPTGYGLAKDNGFVHFVPFVLPLEDVEVSVTEQKKNFAFSKVENIISASPQRVAAKCEVFGKCGGCDWQHIPYFLQLEYKQSFVKETLSKFFDSKTFLSPILPSPNEFNYRNRIIVKKRNGRIGYFKKGSHDLVEIKNCPIAESSINNFLTDLKAMSDGDYLISAQGVEPVSQESLPEFFQINSGLNQSLIDVNIL